MAQGDQGPASSDGADTSTTAEPPVPPLRVLVAGGGSWGTTVAHLCAHNSETTLWARNPDTVDAINNDHRNPRYLPDYSLHPNLTATTDLEEALSRTDLLVMGVPTSAYRDTCETIAPHLRPWVPVVSLAKGFEPGTMLRMSQIVEQVLPDRPVGVLTGPNLAKEIMAGHPTAAVIALADLNIARTAVEGAGELGRQPIVPGAAVEDIVAIGARDAVVAAAQDRVLELLVAAGRVGGPGRKVEPGVEARRQVERVGARTAVERLDRGHGNPGACMHRVVAVAPEEQVVAGAARHGVVTRLAGQRIVPLVAEQDVVSRTAVDLVGIHAHIGSQVFRVDSFAAACGVLGEFANPLGLPELVIGGGLGVPYVEGEEGATITQWASVIQKAMAEAGVTARIGIEPGRAITAAAAITLYTVGTVKDLPDIRTYVAVDGGMSDNPRPVLYGSGYEAFLPRVAKAPRPRRVRIVGKHCESGDLLVRQASVPDDLVVGDILATPVTGAYGHSMGSNYNKVLRPPVVFCRDGDARLVVRRETYDDLLLTDIG